MQQDDFRFLHRLRVRWAEVDAQGVVFFPLYLVYCNTASAEYWRALGLPPAAFAALDADLHVKKVTLEYHGAARYDDDLDVGLHCLRIGNSSLTYALGIFRDGQPLVQGEMVSVFVDRGERRPTSVPREVRAAIAAFEPARS